MGAKWLNLVALLTLIGVFSSCNNTSNTNTEEVADKPNVVSMPAQVDTLFGAQLNAIYGDYVTIKNAMIAGDQVKAAIVSSTMGDKVDSVDTAHVAAADRLRWLSRVKMLHECLDSFRLEATIAGQRKQFSKLSSTLYTVLTEFGMKSGTVYHQFCPMAFDKQGAFWLSNDSAINNPYLPDSMPTCGVTKEVLTFK